MQIFVKTRKFDLTFPTMLIVIYNDLYSISVY